MNVDRLGPAAALLADGHVLVAGGSSPSSGPQSTSELYDPTAGTWTLTGSLHIARYDDTHRATLLPNGKVLVTGGYSPNPSPMYLTSSELYDPSTGAWTTTASMKRGRGRHTATLLLNGQVLVAGGSGNPVNDSGGGPVLASAEVYGLPNVTPILLTSATTLSSGAFQFAFTNTPGASFSVFGTADVGVPVSSWTALGGVTEISPGQFQFTDTQATNNPQRFYRVRSP